MSKKQKRNLTRILICVVLLAVLRFIKIQDRRLEFILYMIPYFIVGYDILKKALKSIRNREAFDENFLMAIATVGAIALGEYQEEIGRAHV